MRNTCKNIINIKKKFTHYIPKEVFAVIVAIALSVSISRTYETSVSTVGMGETSVDSPSTLRISASSVEVEDGSFVFGMNDV